MTLAPFKFGCAPRWDGMYGAGPTLPVSRMWAQEAGVTVGLGLVLLPQAFEPMPGYVGVMGGVLGISMTEVNPASSSDQCPAAR
jgi:hypothetical protein